MYKEIKFGNKARKKLAKGIKTVAKVKVTIGPKGRNFFIEQGANPLVANDAGTIAKEIFLKDKTENMGAQIIKNVIAEVSQEVGGGRTASAILAESMALGGFKLACRNTDMNAVFKGMKQASKDIISNLKNNSFEPMSHELESVATVSTESQELGKIIAETVQRVGKNGILNVESSESSDTEVIMTDGLKFDKGYISPFMVNNQDKMDAEFKDVYIFVTDKKVSSFKDLLPALEKVKESGKQEVVVIADDVDGDALKFINVNLIGGAFQVLAIKAPGYADNKKFTLQDISKLVGATLITDENISSLIEEKQIMTPKGIVSIKVFKDGVLGKAQKVISTKENTEIIGGAGDLEEYIKQLKIQKESASNKHEKERFDERIAKISNKVAIIKVGATSEKEMNYLKLKVQDGVTETKRALEDGIVIGGDIAFIHASKRLKSPIRGDYAKGYNLVLKAVEEPFKQILRNGYVNPIKMWNIIRKIKGADCMRGYDALKNEYSNDMFESKIIDAFKVPKTALEKAVGIVGTFLTTEGTIVDANIKELESKIEY